MISSQFSIALVLGILYSSNAAGPSFSYDDASAVGPAGWSSLVYTDGTVNQCGGTRNSPIAVRTSSCGKYADYIMNGGTCEVGDLEFSLNNHGVKATYKDGCKKNTLNIPDVSGTFEALQFHIHTNSEHTINGESFAAELHIVHKQTNADRYAVVGMMIDVNNVDNHDAFEQLLTGWEAEAKVVSDACGGACSARRLFEDTEESQNNRKLAGFDAYKLVPKGATFYHYDGGLTTPPCSEVVWWNLADIPVSISVRQYQRLTHLIFGYIDPETCQKATVASPGGSTSRPVQPLGSRSVTRICPLSMEPFSKVWTYEGVRGPQNWALLDEIQGNACGGSKNSPIAITSTDSSGACGLTTSEYTFSHGDCRFSDLTFKLNDHGVKAEYSGCSPNTVEIPAAKGAIFDALQFHIHTSSEHTIEGEHYPAELHIVHKQRDADMYAVVGAMIDYDSPIPNESFEILLSGWRAVRDQTEADCAVCARRLSLIEEQQSIQEIESRNLSIITDFDAYDLIPSNAGFFTYDGGLTTPPCSEVVYWNLADKPISISIAQYSELVDIVLNYKNPASCQTDSIASSTGSTSRPPQPRNGRSVTYVCSA